LVLYSGLVGCLALAAFLCTPLLVSVMDERISANVDIEQALRLPMLAAIPKLKLRIENRAHVVRDHVDSVATESFIGIAGQLGLDSADHYPKVILVTSTLPEEGKSLIASNLASAYQRLEKRTVLVDLDLRRPAQHVLHGVPMDDGFIPWAKSASHVDPVSSGAAQVNTCKLPDGVDLIVAGGAISQPGHLLVGKGMEKFIGSLKEQYDVVIIDTPPAGVFQDALVLARHANVTLLVARDSVAPLVQVRKVIDDFSRANLTFRGVVLNSFSPGNANKKLAYAYAAAARGYNYGATSGGTSTRPNGTAIAARTRS
jgi:capsular exopolysaccharide synthesis family protein